MLEKASFFNGNIFAVLKRVNIFFELKFKACVLDKIPSNKSWFKYLRNGFSFNLLFYIQCFKSTEMV